MLPHYLVKFEFWQIWMQTKMWHALIFEHTPNFNAFSLLICCFSFRFMLNILCKQQTILRKEMLWTEAAFAVCLAWHIDQTIIDNAIDEWRGNLRTCVRAKDGHFEQLLCQYSAIWQDTLVFVKCDTIFTLFLANYNKFELVTFVKVVRQHTEGVVGNIRPIWVLLKI